EHGRTVWDITAKDAQYFEREDQIVVIEPVMTFFLDNGAREAHVRGREGRLSLHGRELEAITLRGDVVVRLDDMQLETDEATYDRASDRITTASPVTLRGKTMDLHGRGMEVEVGPQRIRLLTEVHTILHGNAASS